MPAEIAPAEAVRDGVLLDFLDGRWVAPAPNGHSRDLDPAAPAKPLVEAVRSSAADAADALAMADRAQLAWRRVPPLERSALIRQAAGLMRERAHAIATTITLEEGKPLVEARGEVARTAEVLDVVAGLAHRPEGDVFPSRRREQWLLTLSAPLGVVVVIAPWNFPLLIPAWKVAPALLAGNAVVLKPAEMTPLTAAHLVQVFTDAGLPAGVLNLLLGRGSELGPALIAPPAAAVTFTGSNATGAEIARIAVERHLKFQLELGGNNPVLVLADANLDLAANEIVAGAVASTGQKCTATRRVFAERPVAEALTERLTARLAGLRLGPGIEPATEVGPLVSNTARAEFQAAVDAVRSRGAELRSFGKIPDDGYFVQPTLALGGNPDDDLFRDEVFGPLVSIFSVDDFDEGVARCNDTPFGLSAALFSGSIGRAMAFSDEVQAGMVHINSQTAGVEPHTPFGGFKRSSSFSRELGRHGLEFFSQVKTIHLEGA